jgi:CheY-like chemotaxis protein
MQTSLASLVEIINCLWFHWRKSYLKNNLPKKERGLIMKKTIVLLVEDDEFVIENSKTWLVEEGFGVVLAENLEDAKRMLEKVSVDVVVTDMHFPQRRNSKDSFVPCGIAVVATAVEKKIPVIVFSSNGHEADYLKDAVKALEKIAGVKIPYVGKFIDQVIENIKKMKGE